MPSSLSSSNKSSDGRIRQLSGILANQAEAKPFALVVRLPHDMTASTLVEISASGLRDLDAGLTVFGLPFSSNEWLPMARAPASELPVVRNST
jgi:hypothetical protein